MTATEKVLAQDLLIPGRPDLPPTGFLRLAEIINVPAKNGKPAKLGIIPVSAAHWYRGVRAGRYPPPTRAFGSRISAWSVADIAKLIRDAQPANSAGDGE